MNKKKLLGVKVLGLVLVLALHSSLFTFDSFAGGPGTTGASFLKIGAGARPVGMGEAFVGVADDVNAIAWNPAGLIFIDNKEISFMYNMWFQNISYSYLAYAQKMPDSERIGLSITYVGYGDISRTLENASGEYAGTSGNFTASDVSASFSLAKKVNDFGFGGSFKFIYGTLDNYYATAIGFDLGVLYVPAKYPKLTFGITAQNMGSPLVFTTYSNAAPLPLTFKFGAGYKAISTDDLTALTSLDIIIPIENKVSAHLGMELWIQKILAVRLGYKTDTMIDINPLAGLCAGVGFKFSNYTADFAYVPYGDLGNTYRFSIGAKF